MDELTGLIAEYYDYILEDKNFSKEKEIVFEILQDFTGRRGLSQEWDQISQTNGVYSNG